MITEKSNRLQAIMITHCDNPSMPSMKLSQLLPFYFKDCEYSLELPQ